MCTALTLTMDDGTRLFGRNMDLEYQFNQQVILVPRHFKWKNVVTGEEKETTYAILGMASLMEGYPMFADGMNEKGLGCAGLNFPGYAYYEPDMKDGKRNLAPHDIILWILSEFETIEEVRKATVDLRIVHKTLTPTTPIATLHWMVADKKGDSLVIEQTQEGLKIYDNTVGVLTNAPTFDWHLTNLRQYMALQSTQPPDVTWYKEHLMPLGQGVGLVGLPGDFTPASRFIRVAYLKSHSAFTSQREEGMAQFFHILENVAMVGGAVTTPEGKSDLTLYTSCMDQKEGTYYYTTYKNHQLNAIHLYKEDLDAAEIKAFEYRNHQEIFSQN